MVSNYFNDSPILNAEDDLYGSDAFARSMAQSINSLENPIGTTIALNGPWGAGKSSAINLIRAHLDALGNDKLSVSEFTSWWFRGEEALALAFLQHLNSEIRDNLGDKVADVFPQLGKKLLQTGPMIGAALGMIGGAPGAGAGVAQAGVDFLNGVFGEGDPLASIHGKLSSALAEDDHRYLIVIDDIDRLNPDEALAVFRAIKSVGRLPNIIYLLAFDRELAEAAVKDRYPSEGAHFLEKIVQASFEVPPPTKTDLNAALLGSAQAILGPLDSSQQQRFGNVFHDVVSPYISTPRHVARLCNAISVSWPAISDEVNAIDFLALETLRLYERDLFNAIAANQMDLCGISTALDGGRERADERLRKYTSTVKDKQQSVARQAMQRLFPRLENIGYSDATASQWNAERRVCVSQHFETYFRLSLSDDALSVLRINEIIARAEEGDFIKQLLRTSAAERRRTGTSAMPVLLDEMITHAEKLDVEKLEPLFQAMFEVFDEVNLSIDEDRGGFSCASTERRYHWFIRQATDGRVTREDRTQMYLRVLPTASLGWQVEFASSIQQAYLSDDALPDRGYLVSEEAVSTFVDLALTSIRSAAESGHLIDHSDLVSILYRWRDFCGNDPTEPRSWTEKALSDPKALIQLAHAFTDKTYSIGIGMFGLADRVSKVSTVAKINPEIDVLDAERFRKELIGLLETDLPEDDRATVTEFLDAWKRRDDGRDD